MSTVWPFALYERLPVWGQNVACSLAGARMRWQRYGGEFEDAVRLLSESERWSLEEQQAYQDERLRETIRMAYDSVPYYRETFDRLKLKPDDIRTSADLSKLPVLDKATVRLRYRDLIARGRHGKIFYSHTGGTTGTALNLAHVATTQRWQWAVWWRHRSRFGARLSDSFIVFAGRNVVPLWQLQPPFWRRNLAMHQTYISIHHMTRANMAPLVDYLQRRKVHYYSGYPSGLYLLASYLLENEIRLRYPPRAIFTGAETLLPHQRSALEAAIGGEVADQYGASEQCGNISECEHHRYHVDMEFGVVELLPLPGVDGKASIVCTGLRNPVMPLIRYDIGDVATVGEQSPCSCGRSTPTVDFIDGRIESYVITPDGRRLGRLDFLFKETQTIVEAQLIQDRLDHVAVRLVVTPAYCAKDEVRLLEHMRAYLGQRIGIEIERVPEIPKEQNGKFRQIVSHVYIDRLKPHKTEGELRQ